MDQSAQINPGECKSPVSNQCGKADPGVSWEFLTSTLDAQSLKKPLLWMYRQRTGIQNEMMTCLHHNNILLSNKMWKELFPISRSEINIRKRLKTFSSKVTNSVECVQHFGVHTALSFFFFHPDLLLSHAVEWESVVFLSAVFDFTDGTIDYLNGWIVWIIVTVSTSTWFVWLNLFHLITIHLYLPKVNALRCMTCDGHVVGLH